MSDPAKRSVYVPQGRWEISDDSSVYMTTVLGSCVAAGVWDARRGVGGLNHLLLPPSENMLGASEGVHLMELLINGVLKAGGRKSDLHVKLFGGARMMDGCSDIGARNAAFAREFFAFEGIRVVKESLGGTTARRIQFWPATGQARLRLVVDHSAVRAVQAQSRRPVPQRQAEIELF